MVYRWIYLLFLFGVVCAFESEEYIDPIIDMLLNGRMDEETSIEENEPKLNGGIWKCGNCSGLDEASLTYSEVFNYLPSDDENTSGETEFELTLEGLTCVTVSSSTPGIVLHVTGSCNGTSVTLTMKPDRYFVIQGYN